MSTLRALDILTDDPDRVKPFLTETFPIGGGALFGFAAICALNLGTRRPLFSGIQRHVIAAIVGGGLGHTVEGWRNDYFAERDAVLRHYVELHPDLFPDQERKKFADILQPWAPIR